MKRIPFHLPSHLLPLMIALGRLAKQIVSDFCSKRFDRSSIGRCVRYFRNPKSLTHLTHFPAIFNARHDAFSRNSEAQKFVTKKYNSIPTTQATIGRVYASGLGQTSTPWRTPLRLVRVKFTLWASLRQIYDRLGDGRL